MVYASTSLSLAALELLVHLNPPVLFRYVCIRIDFADSLVATLNALPEDWRVYPPPPSTQAIGDAWVRANSSVALAVPSVVVPGERNLIVNPAHPDFRKFRIAKPEYFAFDPRLLA